LLAGQLERILAQMGRRSDCRQGLLLWSSKRRKRTARRA
jgi:hypothetical protein